LLQLPNIQLPMYDVVYCSYSAI